MANGALFAVPIPEQYEAVGQQLQEAVEVALEEAEQKGINKLGKEATPWLLKRVSELTRGKSLPSSKSPSPSTPTRRLRIVFRYCAD